MSRWVKPLPPAAYTGTIIAVYAAIGVGSIIDALHHPTAIPGLLAISFATLAICEAVRGVPLGECVAGAAVVPCLCCTFALAPPIEGSWGLWSYAAFGGAVIAIGVRCSWLSRR